MEAAFPSPPCTVRSDWRSPSRLNPTTRTRPSTGLFQIDVRTARPCQLTSRGSPTFNEITFMRSRPSILLLAPAPGDRRACRLFFAPPARPRAPYHRKDHTVEGVAAPASVNGDLHRRRPGVQ